MRLLGSVSVLHLRDDPSDPSGFWWSPGHYHEVVWEDERLQAYKLVGTNPSGAMAGHFYRVTAEEALEAAQMKDDAD